MNATQIPFVQLLGLNDDKNKLSLDLKDNVKNHINTIHAGAQFTLAETKSGLFLQELFPELEGKVLPILRDAQIKYKKPALEKIIAYASVKDESIEKFKIQFEKKGRGSIVIDVELKDINNVCTAQAVFSWFIQKV